MGIEAATGEGNPGAKMKFSNNVFKDVRIGGYHAYFTPFYLNNSFVTSSHSLLNDTQSGFLNVEHLKPLCTPCLLIMQS